MKLGSDADFHHTKEKVKELLADTGHFLQQEQPVALNRLLLEFLH